MSIVENNVLADVLAANKKRWLIIFIYLYLTCSEVR